MTFAPTAKKRLKMPTTNIEHRIIFSNEQLDRLRAGSPSNMDGLYLQRDSLEVQYKDTLVEVFHNYLVEVSDEYSISVSDGSYHLRLGADWERVFKDHQEKIFLVNAYQKNNESAVFNHEISFMHTDKLKESLFFV